MYKRKKLLTTILLFCCLFLFAITVFAHSGRTDSNGGHYNHSTGEYHYHTGEYAGRESSSGTSWWMKYLFLSSILPAIGLVYYVYDTVSCSLPHYIIFNLENSIHNFKVAKKHTEFCNKELKGIEEKAIIPDGYEIGKDGLPREINSTDWGESLTVYIVRDGWKLHLQEDCCGSFFYKRNVYCFYNKRYSLCKKCASNYNMPNMDWYIEYLKLDTQRRKCKVAKTEQDNALTKLQNCIGDCNKKLVKFFLLFTPSKKKKVYELRKEAIYVSYI